MYCPECGNRINAEVAFCGNCGAAIAPIEFVQEQSPQNSNLWLWLFMSIIIITCLGGTLVAAGWYVYGRPETQPIALLDRRQTQPEYDLPTRALPTLDTEAGAPASVIDTSSAVTIPLTATPQTPSGDPSGPTEAAVSPATLPALLPTKTNTPSPTPTSAPPPTNTPTATPTRDTAPEIIVIGYSTRNTPLEAHRFGSGDNVIVLVGGLHAGFVPGSVTLANRAIDHFRQNPAEIPATVTIYILPNVNPDSPYNPGELSGRLNANGVDLNRNWDCRWTADPRWRNVVRRGIGGSAPLSEPETRALADFLLAQNPRAVVFWQAMVANGLASPGNCGARSQNSEALARFYGLAAGYRIADFEQLTNQVINGDVTNWLDSQGVPAVSILLPNYTNADWANNLAGMNAVLRAYE